LLSAGGAAACVTFERIDPLSTIAADLTEGSGAEPTWHLCLADLLMVTDLLDTPSVFVAYATARQELASDQTFHAGMESDLLNSFLSDGFRSLQKARSSLANSPTDHLVHAYNSGAVNAYFAAVTAGLPASKPTLELPQLILAALSDLFDRRHRAWRRLSVALTSQPSTQWTAVRKAVCKARRTARRVGVGQRIVGLAGGVQLIYTACRNHISDQSPVESALELRIIEDLSTGTITVAATD
jgi:hypothetical protein